MNQRVVFFVALVCIAQLGVTLTRNFWSEQSRKVQHASLARGINQKNISPSSAVPLQRDSSTASSSTALPKKAKPSKSTPGNPLSKPTPTTVNPSLHGEAGTTDIAIPSTPARESAQPATRALLPSPNASDIPTADVTTVAKQSTRDPFVPFFSIRKDAAGDGSRTLSDYELSELKVTAILSDSRGGHFASIKTPSGKDFIVKPGSMIGARGGRIATILPSKLVIVEPAETATGSAGAIQRELSLKTPSASQGIVRAN